MPQVRFRATACKGRRSRPVKGPKFPPPPRKWMDLDFNQTLTTSLAAIRITWRNVARLRSRVYTPRRGVSANRTGNYTGKLCAGAALRWPPGWGKSLERLANWRILAAGAKRLAENFCQLTAESSLHGVECSTRRSFSLSLSRCSTTTIPIART